MFFGLVGAAAVDALAAGTGARSRGGPIGESRRGSRRSFYHRRPRATARSPALVIAVGAERGRFMKTAIFAPFETSPARTSATRVQVWMTARWEKFGGRSTPSRTVPLRMSALATQQVTARLVARVARRLAKVRASSAPSRAPAPSPLLPSAAHENVVAFSRFSLVYPIPRARSTR